MGDTKNALGDKVDNTNSRHHDDTYRPQTSHHAERMNWQPAFRWVGEANHPVPNEQQRHNIVIPQNDLDHDQYNSINCHRAGIRRRNFDARVDRLTEALGATIGQTRAAIADTTAPPHNYVRSPEPNTPTSIDKLFVQIEVNVSAINATTINGNNDTPRRSKDSQLSRNTKHPAPFTTP